MGWFQHAHIAENQDRVYFESQVKENYEDWFECNLAACMLQATMRSVLSHMCRIGKPCQKSEFTCRVGKPSSNLYLHPRMATCVGLGSPVHNQS